MDPAHERLVLRTTPVLCHDGGVRWSGPREHSLAMEPCWSWNCLGLDDDLEVELPAEGMVEVPLFSVVAGNPLSFSRNFAAAARSDVETHPWGLLFTLRIYRPLVTGPPFGG